MSGAGRDRPARLLAALALLVSGAALAFQAASAARTKAMVSRDMTALAPAVDAEPAASRPAVESAPAPDDDPAPEPEEPIDAPAPAPTPALQTQTSAMRPIATYAFRVGESPKLDVLEVDTDNGPMAQLELVVPLASADNGEVVSVEVAGERRGAPSQGWRLVEDFTEAGGELRIPLGKRLLRDGEPVPADPVRELAPGGIPRLVRISVHGGQER